MKVYKVADVIDGEVIVCTTSTGKRSELAALLTNIEPASNLPENNTWKMELKIGEGAAARQITLDIAQPVGIHRSQQDPLVLFDGRLVLFMNRIFMPERIPKGDGQREEVCLRVKKVVYDEKSELANLKGAVANLEAAIEYSKSKPNRKLIPDDVKLLVWARDGGACVRCGSQQNLHFNHIIPVAKGGGNDEENIEILCQPCNLKKSDKLAD